MCVATLYFGRVVFVPFALALLFALLLSPVVSFLERAKAPRLLAIFSWLSVCLGSAERWVGSPLNKLSDLSKQLPTYKQTLESKIQTLQGMRSGSFAQLCQGEMARNHNAPPDMRTSAAQKNTKLVDDNHGMFFGHFAQD